MKSRPKLEIVNNYERKNIFEQLEINLENEEDVRFYWAKSIGKKIYGMYFQEISSIVDILVEKNGTPRLVVLRETEKTKLLACQYKAFYSFSFTPFGNLTKSL